MKNIPVSPAAIARLAVLVLALANQTLALLGRGHLPFCEETVYQAVTLCATLAASVVAALKNNNFSRLARLAGGILQALSDGRLTPEEAQWLLQLANPAEPDAAGAADGIPVDAAPASDILSEQGADAHEHTV